MRNVTALMTSCWTFLLLVTVALAAPAARAQDPSGEYRMTVRLNDRDSELDYTLYLSRDSSNNSDSSYLSGTAEMTVERQGRQPRGDQAGRDYGSMLSVYLKDRTRVVHRGTWNRSNNSLTVQLTDIDGRKDRAQFTATLDRNSRVLHLTCSNKGMYGNAVSFRMERNGRGGGGGRDRDDRDGRDNRDNRDNNGNIDSRDLEGSYRVHHSRRIDGRDIELDYTLRLNSGGSAEMEIRSGDRLRNTSEISRAFGSIATVYLGNDRSVYHRGRWYVTGNTITVELTDINGKKDRAVFTGSRQRGGLDLTVNNKGMYGDQSFYFDN